MDSEPSRRMASGVALPRSNISDYSPQERTVTLMSDLLPNVLPPGSPLARRVALVSCWLCGIRLHQNQMVPDGCRACLDLRWYCKDTRACTERWTSAQP